MSIRTTMELGIVDDGILWENKPEPAKAAKRRYYRAMSRTLLIVDELPQRDLPRYEKDFAVNSWVGFLRSDGSVKIVDVCGEEVIVPLSEMKDSATLSPDASEEEMRLAKLTALDGVLRQEDKILLPLLEAAVHPDHVIKTQGIARFSALNLAMMLLEDHELPPANLFAPEWFVDILYLMPEAKFVPNDQAGEMHPDHDGRWGNYLAGTLRQGVNVYIADAIPDNTLWMTAPAPFVGALPVREYSQVSFEILEDGGRGYQAKATTGLGIINDYTVVKIEMLGVGAV